MCVTVSPLTRVAIHLLVLSAVRVCPCPTQFTLLFHMLLLPIPCAEIRKRTKIIDIIEYTLKQKWKWAGHIARLKDNRWTRRCTEWQPRRGKRSRGRPSRRWQDDITEKEGTTWIRKATDRRRWKTLMEGYILQWMDKA